KSLGTKLAHEETTLFYGDEVLASRPNEPAADRDALRATPKPAKAPAELAPASAEADSKATDAIRVSEKEPTLAPPDKDEDASPITAADDQPSPLPRVEKETAVEKRK
ncbi:MAG: hypothetical protein ACYC35_28795, partial [Pirellulales bacterium]